ncbi:MAG: HAD hydrolase family protein [bacterium]|nr:HAD hydrolase family protein [bacterium]
MSLLSTEQLKNLSDFVQRTDLSKMAIFLDVDQTIVLEQKGKIYFTRSVERGIKDIHDLRIPVVLNTLRFPLSVIRTLGEEWYKIVKDRIPVVLLNGSMCGYIEKDHFGRLEFTELESFPLSESEIDFVIKEIKYLCNENVRGILLFFYPRDWKSGEIIWTPDADQVQTLKEKYTSASNVISTKLAELEIILKTDEICMIFRHIETPQDHLMAYQHSGRSMFVTRKGVDKAFGAKQIAKKLNKPIDLKQSLGAGDTTMDTFLNEMAFDVHVGTNVLPFQGSFCTVMVKDPLELGEILFAFADFAKSKLKL